MVQQKVGRREGDTGINGGEERVRGEKFLRWISRVREGKREKMRGKGSAEVKEGSRGRHCIGGWHWINKRGNALGVKNR